MHSRRPDPPLTFDFLAVNTGRFLLTGFCFFHASVRTSASRRGALSTAIAAPRQSALCLLLSWGRSTTRRGIGSAAFPGITRMVHWPPALVLAQHLGRNLRFKGSLCAT